MTSSLPLFLSFSPSLLLSPVQTEEQRVQQQQSQETRLAELERLLQVLATKSEVTSISEKYTQYPITYISQYIQEHTGPGSWNWWNGLWDMHTRLWMKPCEIKWIHPGAYVTSTSEHTPLDLSRLTAKLITDWHIQDPHITLPTHRNTNRNIPLLAAHLNKHQSIHTSSQVVRLNTYSVTHTHTSLVIWYTGVSMSLSF